MRSIIGWDIGGAHLKAARLDAGRIVNVVQIASPLWQGTEELHRAFTEAKAVLGSAELNAVTMTAELADIFPDRREGVRRIAALAEAELAPHRLILYAGQAGFVDPRAVDEMAGAIASANWHASATFVARHFSEAIFADMGSTTTDLIPVKHGRIAAHGYSDSERMAHGELVYAGVVRSLLMAGVTLVPFGGRWVPLMNEWFANMSDVYRILGELPEGADAMPTADNQPKTREASLVRLARQIGVDAGEAPPWALTSLGRYFAEIQLRLVTDGAHLLLSHADFGKEAPLVGAGVGRFVLNRLAARLGLAYVDVSDLIDCAPAMRHKAGDCLPASAAALLAA